MAQNSRFAIQILEKIGAPLAAALESVPLKVDDKDVEAAKLMAQMMGQAVQVSIALNNTLNIAESEEQADSTRLALAAIAAPLIGEFYRQNARVPDEQDLKRIVKSQEAVLAFAENFSAADEGKSRLSTIDHSAPLFDKTQTSLVILQALNPVIKAIFEFPFGQSEAKLLQDVSERLQKDAAQIVQKTGGDKLAEILAVKALAEIYADCHRMETARLATASDDSRGEVSLNPVWEAYETKVAMVEAIAGAEGASTSTGVSSQAPSAPVETATIAPVAQPPQAPASNGGNPMSFFGAKPATPVETPTPSPEAVPPAQVSENKEQNQPEPPPQSSQQGQSGGPMSFFKPGAKSDDNAGQGNS